MQRKVTNKSMLEFLVIKVFIIQKHKYIPNLISTSIFLNK